MPLVTWNNTLSVKVESMDEEHKKLIDMINEFYDNIANRSNKENISKLLAGMKAYTLEHFAHEERLMKQCNYWAFDNHKAEHETFIAKVNDVEERFNRGGLVLSLEMTSFLFDWLKNHILGSDKKYSEEFEKHGIK
jgi:hemerythrin